MNTTTSLSATTVSTESVAHKHLDEQICKYVRSPNADFAILLNGRWGCGKSYFINSTLGTNWPDVKKSVVSVNGVQSLQELDTIILMSRYLPKKTAAIAATIPHAIADSHYTLKIAQAMLPHVFGSRFWKFFRDQESGNKIDADQRENGTNDDSHTELLIIDDLERHSNQLPINELLGHIHERYVLQGIRVLFVCDETQIEDDTQFAQCKEKYIRREFQFPAIDLRLLYAVIEERYRKNNLPVAEISAVVRDIVQLAKQFNITNIRTLCSIMDGYVELVQQLNNPSFFEKLGTYLVEHMFPLYNECCNGNLSVKDLDSCGNLDQLDIVGYSAGLRKTSGGSLPSEQDSDAKPTYLEEFASRYETLPHRWYLRKPVFRFVIGNELDKEAFIESFSDRLATEDPARKALETVFAFYEYDEKPLQEAISMVLSGIDSDKYSYRELIQLPRVFGQIIQFNYVSRDTWSNTLTKRIIASIHRMAGRPMSGAEAESLLRSWTIAGIEQRDATEEQLAIIDEVRKIAQQSRELELNSKLEKLFIALKDHNTKDIWDNFPVGDSKTDLLIRFVEAGYADRFAQLGTFGLRWMSQYVQRYLMRTEFHTSVQPIIEAIGTIVRSVQKAIEVQEFTKPQKSRLVELIAVLREAREHLLKQPGMNIEPA